MLDHHLEQFCPSVLFTKNFGCLRSHRLSTPTLAKHLSSVLVQEINAQKEACDKIIHSKDRLIAEFQQELKQKDEDYVKALKKQAEDIDRLISTMHQQTKALIGAYEEELAEIETAFMLV